MSICKLSRMPYAQARVIKESDGTIRLISYYTEVITIDPEGWMSVSGLYSMTTRKHISAFLHEYTSTDFSVAKNICATHLKYNIHTGQTV